MEIINQAQKCNSFQDELERLINSYSLESQSDTPDFILACYLQESLTTFNKAVVAREQWYGRRTTSDDIEEVSVHKVLT